MASGVDSYWPGRTAEEKKKKSTECLTGTLTSSHLPRAKVIFKFFFFLSLRNVGLECPLLENGVVSSSVTYPT